MRTTEKKTPPQLVLNPYTGKYINISPLFEMLNATYDDKMEQLCHHSDQIIKFINLYCEPDSPKELRAALFNMYNIREVFCDIVEFQK